MASGYDQLICLFSPEGKLFQVEYAHKAVKSENVTSIAIKGKNVVVAISEKKVTDKLVEPETVRHIFNVTRHIGCLVTGMQADGNMLLYKSRQKASDFEKENSFEIPVDYLAKLVAEDTQFFTQHAYGRAYGCCLTIFGVDDEFGPQVFKIEPSGHYAGYYATAAGARETEATAFLEKKLKWPERSKAYTTKEIIRLGLSTMQGVINRELQGSELEICIVERPSDYQSSTTTSSSSSSSSISSQSSIVQYSKTYPQGLVTTLNDVPVHLDGTPLDAAHAPVIESGVLRYLTTAEIENELNEMVESGGLQEYIQSRQEMDKDDKGS